MISTDCKIFEEGSAVRARQAEYAREWDEVHIVVFEKKRSGENKESVVSSNCWAYSTQSWSRFMYPFDAIRLGRFIIAKRGITEITCQDSSLTAMTGVALKKEFHVPLEIQLHEDIGSPNFTYTFQNKIRKMLAVSYLPKADMIRAVSNKIKNYLIGSLKIEDAKITVRPIFVDVEKIKNTPIVDGADLHKKYPQFEKIVLMASRLTTEKNIELAIKSWPEIIKATPKVGLIVVGEGNKKADLVKLTSSLGLNRGTFNSVIFESWADQATLASYYKTANLFLNTSLFEGYGMTLVEAQAAGCRIVSTDVGVARDVGATIVEWNEKDVAEKVVKSLQ